MFVAIVRLCLTQVPEALPKILNLGPPKEGKKPPLPSTSKKWAKARLVVKSYIGDMMQVRYDEVIISVKSAALVSL